MLNTNEIKNILGTLKETIEDADRSLRVLHEDSIKHVEANAFLLARATEVEMILSAKQVISILIDKNDSFDEASLDRLACLVNSISRAANNIIEYNSILSSELVEDMDDIYYEACSAFEKITNLKWGGFQNE